MEKFKQIISNNEVWMKLSNYSGEEDLSINPLLHVFRCYFCMEKEIVFWFPFTSYFELGVM